MEKREIDGVIIEDRRREFRLVIGGRVYATRAETKEKAEKIINSFLNEERRAA